MIILRNPAITSVLTRLTHIASIPINLGTSWFFCYLPVTQLLMSFRVYHLSLQFLTNCTRCVTVFLSILFDPLTIEHVLPHLIRFHTIPNQLRLISPNFFYHFPQFSAQLKPFFLESQFCLKFLPNYSVLILISVISLLSHRNCTSSCSIVYIRTFAPE